MKLNPFSQILITVGGFVVAVGLIYFSIISPLFNQIQESAARLIADELTLLSLDRPEQEIRKLQEEVAQAQAIEPLLTKTLLKPEEALTFIVNLETLGKATNVVYDINIDNTPAERIGLAHLTFQVNAEGPYLNVARFIEGVEKMPYYTQINRFQLTRRSERGEASASINLWAFSNQ